jgi:hypothetical protein
MRNIEGLVIIAEIKGFDVCYGERYAILTLLY